MADSIIERLGKEILVMSGAMGTKFGRAGGELRLVILRTADGP
jgi:hypothetical protein